MDIRQTYFKLKAEIKKAENNLERFKKHVELSGQCTHTVRFLKEKVNGENCMEYILCCEICGYEIKRADSVQGIKTKRIEYDPNN